MTCAVRVAFVVDCAHKSALVFEALLKELHCTARHSGSNFTLNFVHLERAKRETSECIHEEVPYDND